MYSIEEEWKYMLRYKGTKIWREGVVGNRFGKTEA